MKLTPNDCLEAKPGTRPYKRTDGAGLYLYVAPSGGRLWRFDYAFQGRRKTLSLGAFPGVSLDDARAKAGAARGQLIEGRDPTGEKKLARMTAELAQRQTFGLVAEELLDKMQREGRAATTLAKNRWLLTDLAADLKDRPVRHVGPVDILAVLRKAEGRGRLESARRLRSAIGQVMRYAVATGRADADPTPNLRGAIAVPRVQHRPAIITPEGAGKLMTAIGNYEGAVVRHALTVMAYCFPRPGELRLAKWSEVDLRAKVWTLPEERTKMRREHRIPLSPQALKAFKSMRQTFGDKPDAYCFPSLRPNRPLSEATLNAALRTLGYDSKSEHCAHGFRAMASSLLNEYSDFSADAIERALAHVDSNAVRRAYHRAEHWGERVQLMKWWADYLDAQAFKVWRGAVLA